NVGSWSAQGLGSATVATEVEFPLGTSELTLQASTDRNDVQTRLKVEVTPDGDGGPNSALLTISKVADPSATENLIGGAVRFSNVRVSVTADTDQSGVTGPSGKYGVTLVTSVTDAISCAEMPLGPGLVPRKDAFGNTRYEFQAINFASCSPVYTVF